MKILIATHNQSKFKRYYNLLVDIPQIELISLSELGINDKVDEPFDNALENAIHKAKTYGNLSNLITLAIDDECHTNFLPSNEQPTVYVRRLNKDKKEFTDTEVLSF